MSNINKVKSEQLGMSFSTASHQLRKMIMFKLIQECGLDNCHRCGEKIEIENLSIEHIENWLHSESPKELFFDLDNIAFSHMSCNFAHARKPESKRKSGEALKRHIGKLGLIGVYYDGRYSKPYRARIMIKGKSTHLGYFATKEESAEAVDNALIDAYGEDVETNKSLGLV